MMIGSNVKGLPKLELFRSPYFYIGLQVNANLQHKDEINFLL